MKFLPLLVLLLPSVLLADGLPIDAEAGKIFVPHQFIKISASQQEEITTLGTLTLTSEQWSGLRKVRKGCPKRFSTVFPRDWNDCTCGSESGAWAIDWGDHTVAVLLETIPEDPTVELRASIADHGGAWLTMDARGQFYFKGVLIPYPSLLEAVAVPAKPDKRPDHSPDPRIGIDIPVGCTENSPALRARLTEIGTLAKSHGWEVYIH